VSRRGLSCEEVGRRPKRKRHPNYRLVKIYRCYTVEEIARLFGVHRNTVWDWIKRRGLPTIDDRRPMFIHGRDLVDFLQKRRAKNKRKCQPGEIYCLRCRAPQKPAGDMADYKPITTTRGNLVAICPSCESMIHRGVNLGKLDQVRGNLQVTMPQALPHIVESSRLCVNSELRQGAPANANAQRK
jgi:excisionase family DNA binding protein